MRDIKYIIKRILIGVGIALCLIGLKSVNAKEISSINITGVNTDISASVPSYDWDMADGSWGNWGSGSRSG